jgi:hypothetical protein
MRMPTWLPFFPPELAHLPRLADDLRAAMDRADAQAIEDCMARLTDATAKGTPEMERKVVADSVGAAAMRLARLQDAWCSKEASRRAAHLAALRTAVGQAKGAIDTKMRLRAVGALQGVLSAAEAALSPAFTADSPCLCADTPLFEAMDDAALWVRALDWVNRQRKSWIALSQAAASAVQTNGEGAGRESLDYERSAARDALRNALREAERLLADVPGPFLHSKDHTMLVDQTHRAGTLAEELDKYWAAEWAVRKAARPSPDPENTNRCGPCGAAVGWRHFRQPRPCAQCGALCCPRCLTHDKALRSLAYAEPVGVCDKCSNLPVPHAPRPPLPESLRWSGAKATVFKPTVLAALY